MKGGILTLIFLGFMIFTGIIAFRVVSVSTEMWNSIPTGNALSIAKVDGTSSSASSDGSGASISSSSTTATKRTTQTTESSDADADSSEGTEVDAGSSSYFEPGSFSTAPSTTEGSNAVPDSSEETDAGTFTQGNDTSESSTDESTSVSIIDSSGQVIDETTANEVIEQFELKRAETNVEIIDQKPVMVVSGYQKAKFFGIIPVDVPTEVYIDRADTSQADTSVPWWTWFVKY